ncbi:polymorphic toxin-type HINT domain-containing protein [Haliscomenobacter sp.]|uniref:polymorphic toxin-type HINT domain-containing protein n=1 Tax=Haliscomenobacter sp. TaxID=2717303 RepID=UPI003593C0DA
MTTPKPLALPYFIGKMALVLSTFLLLTSATMLVQAPQPRVPFPDFQNLPLPVSDFVERYDALMINDPTAVFLDAEAEYLAGIVQRVLGYTGVFKTYEFRMYGPSLIANGEIAFETAAGSFAGKIENGGVVAVRGKGGQPELRKVTQNEYYLMIAMQAQGGNAVKFKVVLKLPKKAGVSDAEHATMEGALGRIGEAELLSQWNKRTVLDEAGIAEAKGTRKIADMLEKWTPGQPIGSDQMQQILSTDGFFSQKVPCSNFSLDNTQAPGKSGNVEYYSHVTVYDDEANTVPAFGASSGIALHSFLLSNGFNTELQKLASFPVHFIITSDKDFQNENWNNAKRSFEDKSKKVAVWIHYSEGDCATNLRSAGDGSANLSIKINSNLSEADINGIGSIDNQNDAWSFLKEWRAKTAWLEGHDSNDLVELFAFGVVCGMMDQALDRLAELVSFVTESVSWLESLGNEIKIAGSKLTVWILNAVKQGMELKYVFGPLGLTIDEFARRNPESINLMITEFSEYIVELEAMQGEFRQQIEDLKKLFQLSTIKAFVDGFITEIVKWLGDIKRIFTNPTHTDIKNLGYSTGKELMDFVISWLTGGAGKLLTNTFSQINKSFKSANNMVDFNFRGGSRAVGDPDGIRTRERSYAAKLGCFISGTLVLTTLGAQPIEALNPATPIPVYQAASTPTSYDPSTTTEFGIQALNAEHTLPGDVQDIDREEITPATWRWLHLSYTKPDGTAAQVYLRRPLWWMQQHGARAPGDHITLLMPEMGIVGRAQLEAILPNTLDTHSWDYRAQGDYAHYPLTGFFAHESAEVWDLYFSSSKQPVGATYNHPFYSTDRGQYIYAGELALGERILTQSGDTVQFLLKRPHADLSTRVYNLEVWRAHNFLVTEKGMVVHNNGCMVEVMGDDPITCLLEILKKKLKDPKLEAALEADLKATGKEFRDELSSKPEMLQAWEALNNKNDPNTVGIRQNVDNLKKLDDFKTSSNKSLAELQAEYEKLPNAEKQAWLDHLEYRSVNGRVAKAGGNASVYRNMSDLSNIPARYQNHSEFSKLSKDPDTGKSNVYREAMTGIEAERQGLLKSPIKRGPRGIEFFDANGDPWDAKTPVGGTFFKVATSDKKGIGDSIVKELTEPKRLDIYGDGNLIDFPGGQYINENTKAIVFKRILLDVSYIDDQELAALRNWLKNDSGLSSDELSRIVEININL